MAYDIMDTYFGGLNVEDWFKSKWMREKNKKALLDVVDQAMLQTQTELGEDDKFNVLSQLGELRGKLEKATPKEGKVSASFIEKLQLGMKGVFPDPDDLEIEVEDLESDDLDESVQLPEYEYEKYSRIYEEILEDERKELEEMAGQQMATDPKERAAQQASLIAKKKAIDALKAKKKREGKNINLNAQTMDELDADEINAAVNT